MVNEDNQTNQHSSDCFSRVSLSSENFQAIFDASPVGLILLDEETTVLGANNAVSAIILKEPGDIIGQRGGGALNCIYSFENEKGCGFSQACPDCPLRKQILAVLATGTPVHGFEIQPTLRLNGRNYHHWLKISAEPIVLNGRKHVLVAIDDITERKHTDELLRESEELQRALIASAPLAVICIDPAGKIMSWNAAAERIFGCKEEEVLGKIPPYINDAQMDEYAANMKRVFEGETLTRIELTRQHKDGTPLNIRLYAAPIHNSGGEVVAVLSILEDITQYKLAEEELDRNQAVLEGIIESSDFPIYAIDTNYCYILFNKCHANTMKLLYGVDIEIGANILEYNIPDADYKTGKIGFDKALRGRHVHNQLCTGGLKKRYYDIVYIPIQINQGNIIGVSVFLTDITQRIDMEEQIEAFYQKLSHASKLSTLGEMASSIAHEINQPLCSIVTYAESCLHMISSKVYNHEKICDILQTIVTQSQRAGEICNQIKNFMRKTPPNPTEVNINVIIQNMLVLMDKQIKKNMCDVKLDLDVSLPSLFVDVVQIEQVMVNIIKNALEATVIESRKSLIVITTSFRSEKEIEIKVCDNGKGIGTINEKELFDRFFTTKKDGLGLGLPISKSIVESYGGRIYIVSNQDGIGVTVGIILPIRD